MAAPMDVDKVDMSLDDIIRLNKQEKKSQGQQGGKRGGQSRGRGQRGAQRGVQRGRGARGRGGRGGGSDRGSSRGQGTRIFRASSASTRGSQRGAGSSGRGRGQGRGQGRGRGRGQSQGRGRGQNRQQTNLGLISSQNRYQSQQGTKHAAGKQNLSLKSVDRRRQEALNTLKQAKQTLAMLSSSRQKTGRQNLVNQRRNIQDDDISPVPKARGRGLKRNFGSTLSINSVGRGRGRGRGRGLLSRSFGGSTMSLVSNRSVSNPPPKKKRRWAAASDDILSVSISNLSSGSSRGRSPTGRGQAGRGQAGRGQSRGGKRSRKNMLTRLPTSDVDPVLAEQIKALKPAVSQTYNFKKAIFSQSSTSVTLNDRFSGGKEQIQQGSETGRKVFF